MLESELLSADRQFISHEMLGKSSDSFEPRCHLEVRRTTLPLRAYSNSLMGHTGSFHIIWTQRIWMWNDSVCSSQINTFATVLGHSMLWSSEIYHRLMNELPWFVIMYHINRFQGNVGNLYKSRKIRNASIPKASLNFTLTNPSMERCWEHRGCFHLWIPARGNLVSPEADKRLGCWYRCAHMPR